VGVCGWLDWSGDHVLFAPAPADVRSLLGAAQPPPPARSAAGLLPIELARLDRSRRAFGRARRRPRARGSRRSG